MDNKTTVLNAKIQRFIDWLPIASIEEGYNNYEDLFEHEDENIGFQIRSYFFFFNLDGFDFLINEARHPLTDEQYTQIRNKIK